MFRDKEGAIYEEGDDQSLQIDWNRRAARSRLPAPEQSPALAVPTDQRLRLDHGKECAPVEELGEEDQRDARRRVSPTRFRAPLLIQRQLLA